MKKYIIIIATLLFFSQLNACPFCGCGVGGFYIGMLPTYKSNFIGVRYETMRYNTHVAKEPDQFSYDHYQLAELWGGASIGRRWQLLGFVPYHINRQTTDDGIINRNGIGDPTIIANYKIWENSNVDFKKKSLVKHELWLGGGIKLPVGKYNVDANDPETELSDANSQMGTGSTDFLVNATYRVTINRFGINTTAGYKINTGNKDGFRYGNRFSASAIGFYTITAKQVNFAPNAGIMFENSAQNYVQKALVEETGGNIAFASAGLEINIKKLTIGGNIQLPFSQSFAHGQTKAETRAMVHVSIIL